MHLFDRNPNFLGGHGIVGGHVPLAAGVGFAIKYRGGDQVIVCFMGESVVNTGAFHEALNMAALWKLPCVFIIENNRYGMGTALERASAIHDIYERGAAYNMPRSAVRRAGRLRGARRPSARRSSARARSQIAHAPRDPHLPLHGTLDVRRGQRHLPHEVGARGAHEARPDHPPPHATCRKPVSSPTTSSTKLDEEIKAIVQDCLGLRRGQPRAARGGAVRGCTRRDDDLIAERRLQNSECRTGTTERSAICNLQSAICISIPF